MIAYKLMSKDMTTHNGFQWELGKTYTIDREGNELCTDQVFHAYETPEHAVLFSPLHVIGDYELLVEIECDCVANDDLKIGSKTQTPLRIIDKPVFSTKQRIVFAILCEKQVRHLRDPIPEYDNWADDFLNTLSSDAGAAETAMAAKAAWAARSAEAAEAATWAAEAAGEAAEAATWAARSAEAATWAAEAAAWAAEAATWAARAAKINNLDFAALAKEALTYEG